MFGYLAVLRLRTTTYADSTGYLSVNKQRIATCHKRDAQHQCVAIASVNTWQTMTVGDGEADVYTLFFTLFVRCGKVT